MGHDKILIERTFEFAVSVLELLKHLGESHGEKVVANQLAKSATSTCPVK